jgi:hypothetical protein
LAFKFKPGRKSKAFLKRWGFVSVRRIIIRYAFRVGWWRELKNKLLGGGHAGVLDHEVQE